MCYYQIKFKVIEMLVDNYNITVWIIEDNPGDAFLLQEMLVENGFSSLKIHIFRRLNEVINSHKEEPDIVLFDLYLPDADGLTGFQQFELSFPSAPVIILSGLGSMDVALEAVKMGAQDFIVKDQLETRLLVKTIHYSIERKKSLDRLILSESKYRLLFSSSPLPHFLLDKDFNIVDTNYAANQLYALDSQNEILNFADFQEATEDVQLLVDAINMEIPFKSTHITHDGRNLFVEILSSRLFFEGKLNFLVMVKDETEKFLMEEQKLKLIHETEDQERERFSKELHDGLAQHMVALNLYLNQLQPATAHEADLINDCKEIVKTSLNQTRTLCYNLTPPELEKGLIAGVDAMFYRLSKVSGIRFELNCEENLSRLIRTTMHEYALYRIIQEFVNNSIKHAKCTQISCLIYRRNSEVVMLLSDNGSGFEMKKVKKGLGMKNISQRAQASGFEWKLKSSKENGTSMELIMTI